MLYWSVLGPRVGAAIATGSVYIAAPKRFESEKLFHPTALRERTFAITMSEYSSKNGASLSFVKGISQLREATIAG